MGPFLEVMCSSCVGVMVERYVNKSLDKFFEVLKTTIDVIKQLLVSPCIQYSENQF